MPASHPDELPVKTKAGIIKICPQHPTFGRQRIAHWPALEGIAVYVASARNFWFKENIQTLSNRVLRLEDTETGEGIQSTEEHIRLLEKDYPCLRERNVEKPVLTDNGRKYEDRPMTRLYKNFTGFNDIERRYMNVGYPRTSDGVERFNRTVRD